MFGDGPAPAPAPEFFEAPTPSPLFGIDDVVKAKKIKTSGTNSAPAPTSAATGMVSHLGSSFSIILSSVATIVLISRWF
jgi:hypothetical protein